MRGRKSGHRYALRSAPLLDADGRESNGNAVLSDVEGNYPVTAAELDAIEAYLWPLIQNHLTEETIPADSEAPHSSVTTEELSAGEDRNEVFAEELV